MSIVFACFTDNGGMFHYAQNLSASVNEFEKSHLAILTKNDTKEQISKGDISLSLKQSKSRIKHRLLEKYNPAFYIRLAKKLNKHLQPKVVHITSYCEGLLAFVNTLKTLGTKTVYTVHDPIPHEEDLTRWGYVFEKYKNNYQMHHVLKNVDAIHTHSQKHKNDLIKIHGKSIQNKIYYVPHGGGATIDIQEGHSTPPEFLVNNSISNLSILFFGRIHPYKGLDQLAKALKIVRKTGLQPKLIVAGAGNIHEKTKRELEDNSIIINRFIHDNEIRKIFEAADIVILPYISATQSGVIPLAYTFNKPVICSNIGALGELVKHGQTGFLVPPL